LRFLKKYIAVFLLAIFVVPQVNNALHYFVVAHDWHPIKTQKKTEVAAQAHDHICAQHIYVLPAFFMPSLWFFEPLVDAKHDVALNGFIITCITRLVLVGFTRGPPLN